MWDIKGSSPLSATIIKMNNPYRAYWEKAQEQSLKLAQFYTPECLVDLCIALLQPTGELFDPCCGLGSFLLKAKANDDNLTISGNDIATDLGELPFEFTHGDYLKLINQEKDYLIANIPFNTKKTHCNLVDENYCWIEKIIANTRKKALIILPSGINSALNKRLVEKRKQIIESGYLELVCQLPSHLFNQTGIAPCLWLINKQKTEKDIYFLNDEKFREWKNKQRFLTEENIKAICDKDNWIVGTYEKVEENNFVLVPQRYEPDSEPKLLPEEIDKKLVRHTYELRYSLHLLIADAYRRLLDLDSVEAMMDEERNAPLANILGDGKRVVELQKEIQDLMLEKYFKNNED